MKFFKQLLIATSLTFNSFLKPKEVPSVTEMAEQLEPEELRDEWQTMMHHDDVTPQERAWLESDDPADIKRAQEAIFKRQEEFQAWWDDKETRDTAFYGPYAKDIKAGVTVPDIQTLEGWEDDEDMPEYYETVVRTGEGDQGKVVRVPYELAERLNELLGLDPDTDKQFDHMFDYLVEVYNERGVITDTDYVVAEHAWDTRNGN